MTPLVTLLLSIQNQQQNMKLDIKKKMTSDDKLTMMGKCLPWMTAIFPNQGCLIISAIFEEKTETYPKLSTLED